MGLEDGQPVALEAVSMKVGNMVRRLEEKTEENVDLPRLYFLCEVTKSLFE